MTDYYDTIDDELTANVDRGVFFLEREVGAEWPNLIDLGELDLGNPEACVIGQTFCHLLQRDKAVGPSAWSAGTFAVADFEDEQGLLDDDRESGSYQLMRGYGFEQGESYGYFDLQAEWERRILEAREA